MMDERQETLTPEEVAARIAARAHAEEADERARLQTIGGAAFGILGLVICAAGFLWKDSVAIGLAGFAVGGIGFGIVTAAQGLSLLPGRKLS